MDCSAINDVRNIGPNKSLGYVTHENIVQAGLSAGALRKELESKGHRVWEFSGGTTSDMIDLGVSCVRLEKSIPHSPPIEHSLFYAYDPLTLQKLLDNPKSQTLLQAKGWPTESEAFVQRVSREWLCMKQPLFDLIADAFGNTTHSGRLDVIAKGDFAHLERLRDRPPLPLRFIPRYIIEGYAEIGIDLTPLLRSDHEGWVHRVNEMRTEAKSLLPETLDHLKNALLSGNPNIYADQVRHSKHMAAELFANTVDDWANYLKKIGAAAHDGAIVSVESAVSALQHAKLRLAAKEVVKHATVFHL